MAVAFPDCYDCENASSINGELWCSLFFHPCSQTIACSRNAPKPEPITNGDKIRASSDEELAEWLFGAWHQSWYTRQEWLDWLREEVTDGEQS